MKTYLEQIKTFLKKWEMERYLEAFLAIFVVLLLVQGARGLSATIQTGTVLRSLEESSAPAPKREATEGIEDYKAMLDKGTFGKGPKGPSPFKVFAIMGNSALLGADPNKVELYAVGADLPGGQKIIEIAPNSVVLEKDGERQTLVVFPELAKP